MSYVRYFMCYTCMNSAKSMFVWYSQASLRQSLSSQPQKPQQKAKQQKRAKSTTSTKPAQIDSFFKASPKKKLKTDSSPKKSNNIDSPLKKENNNDPTYNITIYTPSDVLPDTNNTFQNQSIHVDLTDDTTIDNAGVHITTNDITKSSTIQSNNNYTSTSSSNNTNGAYSTNSSIFPNNCISTTNSNNNANNSNPNSKNQTPSTINSLVNNPLSISSFSKHPSSSAISFTNASAKTTTTPVSSRRSDFISASASMSQRTASAQRNTNNANPASQSLFVSSFSKREFSSQTTTNMPAVKKVIKKKVVVPSDLKSTVVSVF